MADAMCDRTYGSPSSDCIVLQIRWQATFGFRIAPASVAFACFAKRRYGAVATQRFSTFAKLPTGIAVGR